MRKVVFLAAMLTLAASASHAGELAADPATDEGGIELAVVQYWQDGSNSRRRYDRAYRADQERRQWHDNDMQRRDYRNRFGDGRRYGRNNPRWRGYAWSYPRLSPYNPYLDERRGWATRYRQRDDRYYAGAGRDWRW